MTRTDLEDIIITALEGGIGYWACLDNTGSDFQNAPQEETTSETLARILFEGKSATFEDAEDPSEKWDMTLAKLRDGIRLYEEKHGTIDMDMLDAEMADCIFQYGLFGELVYG